MNAIAMIKCFLTRNTEEPGSVRYVPLEIYEMWRFLMERVHRLLVVEPAASIWVPVGPNSEASGEEHAVQNEAVVEIKFKYLLSNNVGKPVVRYFPEDDFDQLYGYLRKHFPDESKMEGVQLRKGYFLAGKALPYTSTK